MRSLFLSQNILSFFTLWLFHHLSRPRDEGWLPLKKRHKRIQSEQSPISGWGYKRQALKAFSSKSLELRGGEKLGGSFCCIYLFIAVRTFNLRSTISTRFCVQCAIVNCRHNDCVKFLTCEIIQYFSFCDWLSSPTIMSSSFIHFVTLTFYVYFLIFPNLPIF